MHLLHLFFLISSAAAVARPPAVTPHESIQDVARPPAVTPNESNENGEGSAIKQVLVLEERAQMPYLFHEGVLTLRNLDELNDEEIANIQDEQYDFEEDSRELRPSYSSPSSPSSSNNPQPTCTELFCSAPDHPKLWCKQSGESYYNTSDTSQQLTCSCTCNSYCCMSATDKSCSNSNLYTGACSIGYCEEECPLPKGAIYVIAAIAVAIVICCCVGK
jgi:hypothetical protein